MAKKLYKKYSKKWVGAHYLHLSNISFQFEDHLIITLTTYGPWSVEAS